MLCPADLTLSTHFLRFVQSSECEWIAVLRVTRGTHQFSLDFLSKWLEIKLSARARGFESHPLRQEVLEAQCFKDFYFSRRFLNSHRQQQNGAHGAEVCGARPVNEIFGISLLWCSNGARHLKSDL